MNSTDNLPTYSEVQNNYKLIEEAADPAHGWTLDSEGLINKHFPENKIVVHKKHFPGESIVRVKYDAIIRNTDLTKWMKVSHAEHRKKWDPYLKHMEQAVQPDGTKLSYIQAKMPFPLTDRDFVQKSFTICNKSNPELVEKYNLPKVDYAYCLGMVESTVSSKFPERKDHVRGETQQITLVEEMRDKEGGIRIRSVSHSDIKGSIPAPLLNTLATRGPYKILSKQIETYPELLRKGLI